MKDCGGCTLCCSVLEVPWLDKPRNTQCKHACPSGCSIYDTRPSECQAFECLYRFGNLSDRMRPDRCGVVFELWKSEKAVIASVDAFRPNAWQRGAASRLIRRMVEDGYTVWVVAGGEKHAITPDGEPERSLDKLKRVWRSRAWRHQHTQPTSPI